MRRRVVITAILASMALIAAPAAGEQLATAALSAVPLLARAGSTFPASAVIALAAGALLIARVDAQPAGRPLQARGSLSP